MLEKLTYEDFKKHLNETFQVHPGKNETIELVLIEASPLGTEETAPKNSRRSFSIVFKAPAHASFPQQIFRITHHELGEMDLFLVPLGPGGEGMLYEAVFT